MWLFPSDCLLHDHILQPYGVRPSWGGNIHTWDKNVLRACHFGGDVRVQSRDEAQVRKPRVTRSAF